MAEDPKKPPPTKVDPSKPPPPPLAGKLADVAPYQAPYEPPPGSMSAPRQRPIWRSNGKDTGQLVSPAAPLPKTVELELPEVRASNVPQTRELGAPDGSGLFAETTNILNQAQLGTAPAAVDVLADLEPDIDDERTDQIPMKALADAVSDLDTIGDTDSPLDFDDTTAPQKVLFYEETTAILKDRDLPDDDER